MKSSQFSALNALNALSARDPRAIVCSDGLQGGERTIADLCVMVSTLRARIAARDAERWLLHADDTFRFAAGMLALLSLDRTVVLTANCTEGWLDSITGEYDALLTDMRMERAGHLDFGTALAEPDIRAWRGAFSGTERIVFFTSGSTGVPKRIDKTLQLLLNEIDTLVSVFPDAIDDNLVLASVSHQHIYGLLFKLLLPLLGGTQWLNPQITFCEQLLPFAASGRRLTFVSSPAFLSRLDPDLSPCSFDAVFSSGGPLALEHAQATGTMLGVLPVEVYGSTETGGIAYRQQTAPGAPWQLFPRMEIEILDGIGHLRSPHVGDNLHYPLDDELELLPERKIQLKGRRDRIVKIEEKRVSLTELEQYLRGMEFIDQAVVLAMQGRRNMLGAVLVLSQAGRDFLREHGRNRLVSVLGKEMSRRFEKVTVPRKWRIVDAFPVDTQSKINTLALLELFA